MDGQDLRSRNRVSVNAGAGGQATGAAPWWFPPLSKVRVACVWIAVAIGRDAFRAEAGVQEAQV